MIDVETGGGPPDPAPNFTTDDYKRLKQSLQIFDDAEKLLPKGGACDIECQFFATAIKSGKRELEQVREAYFSDPKWESLVPEVQGIRSMGPLYTSGHFAELKKAQRAIHDLIPAIQCAEGAGNDCDVLKSRLAAVSKKLAAIEREFFTPPPT